MPHYSLSQLKKDLRKLLKSKRNKFGDLEARMKARKAARGETPVEGVYDRDAANALLERHGRKLQEAQEEETRPVSARPKPEIVCPQLSEDDLNTLQGCDNIKEYRKLILKFHPDKTPTGCDRKKMTEYTQRINSKRDDLCKK